MPATKKQLDLIERIELILDIKFTGITVREASSFISKHLEDYQDQLSENMDMVNAEYDYY